MLPDVKVSLTEAVVWVKVCLCSVQSSGLMRRFSFKIALHVLMQQHRCLHELSVVCFQGFEPHTSLRLMYG